MVNLFIAAYMWGDSQFLKRLVTSFSYSHKSNVVQSAKQGVTKNQKEIFQFKLVL